jgi:hypothetical protein
MISSKFDVVNEIINGLIKKGGTCEQLYDTDAMIVRYNNRNHFFLKDMTPLVSITYGNFTSKNVYINEILHTLGIPFVSKNRRYKSYKVLITSNGYMCLVSEGKAIVPSSVQKEYWYEIKKISQKVCQAFSNTPYICVDMTVDKVFASNDIDTYSISNVSFSLSDFANSYMYKNGKPKQLTEVFIDLILRQNF